MAERNVETSVCCDVTHAKFSKITTKKIQIAVQNSQMFPRKQLCRCCTWHGTLLRA